MTSLAAGSLLTGCASGAASAAAPGTVVGQFIRVGGPAPGSPVPLPGVVVTADSGGTRHEVAVGRNGWFRLSLPAGHYRLTGYSPLIGSGKVGCRAEHVIRVAAGKTTRHVTVTCSIP
jgi:hypothetical protein